MSVAIMPAPRTPIELKRHGTQVVGVHPGTVDTDMTAAFDVEKISPATVATLALDAQPCSA